MTDTGENKKRGMAPKVKTKDGSASKLVDAITDTTTAVVKTGIEIVRAPLTVAARTVDGVVQGTSQGANQGDQPIEKVGKAAMGTVGGTVQGTVKGVEKAAQRIGKALGEVGKGVSKIGEALVGTADEVGELTGIKREEDKE